MNESGVNRNDYGTMEIDLVKLSIQLLRRWRVLLLCLLIGALIGGGSSILRGINAVDESASGVVNSDEIPHAGFLTPESELDFGTYEEMTAALGIVTDPAKLTSELVNMTRLNQYIEYKKMYEDELESERKSGLTDSEGNIVISDTDMAIRALTIRQSYQYKVADFKRDYLSAYDLAYYEYKYGDKEKAAQILNDYAQYQVRDKKRATLEYKAASDGGILGQLAKKNAELKAESIPTTNRPLDYFSIRRTLLGAFAALFLILCWYGLRFILDKRIKGVDELKSLYRLNVIGSLDNHQPQSGIDGLIDKIEYRNEVTNDKEYIAEVVKSLDFGSMLLAGDRTDEDVVGIMDWIATQDSRCSVSGFLIKDNDAPNKAKACDGIILFVHLWKTTSTELIHELEMHRSLGRKIIGVITI